jgi:dolichol kinase
LLLAVCFADSLKFALAVIAILAFGDSFSTLIGRSGAHKLPFSGRKTLEGFGAFVVAATVGASLFIRPELALGYSFILGVVELVDLKADDNLSIPIVALAVRTVLK